MEKVSLMAKPSAQEKCRNELHEIKQQLRAVLKRIEELERKLKKNRQFRKLLFLL